MNETWKFDELESERVGCFNKTNKIIRFFLTEPVGGDRVDSQTIRKKDPLGFLTPIQLN